MGADKKMKELPLGRSKHDDDFSDDDFDLDEEYFERTYRPLSNLPTPPPSSKNSSATQSPVVEMHDGELLQPALIGAAIHLVNLLPPAASLATASISLVQAMLARADLPEHTVALAVCIMDSLNSKFSRRWRLSCPLAPPTTLSNEGSPSWPFPTGSKRHTLAGTGSMFQGQYHHHQPQLHIDSVSPEVIVLAAMMIAAKFTEDSQESTRWYASAWGRGIWTCEQINVTERCIMENLGYRIMPLTAPDVLQDALSDMARAAKSACVASGTNARPQSSGWAAVPGFQGSGRDDSHFRSKSCGKQGLAGLAPLQLTVPTDSP